MFIKTDYVELYSAKKVHFYHHKKDMRNEKYVKKQRIVKFILLQARLRWLKSLCKKSENQEAEQLVGKMEEAEQNGVGSQLAQ